MIRNFFNQLKYEYRNLLWHKSRINEIETSAKLFYDNHYESWTVENNSVLYDIQDGHDLDDSPFEILKYWLSNHSKMRHVIVTRNETKDKLVRILKVWQLDDNQKISVVEYQSEKHLKALLTSKYVITNAMIFSDIFVKRSGQIFINTWHGTPLKKMGYAMPGGVMGSWNVIRTLMMADYLIMPNNYTSEIFKRDYRLNGLYTGKIIETGYPRNDVFINRLPQHQLDILNNTTMIGHKRNRIVLYAPTWSGDTTKITSNRKELEGYLSVLGKVAKLNHTEIKFKPLPFFKAVIDADLRFDAYRLIDAIGTNDLLSEIDVLITDYSSLFFDFLVSGKPIVFFDIKENYKQERGEYIAVSSLPGPYTQDVNKLIALLTNTSVWFNEYHQVYKQFKTEYVSRDDGSATQRVADEIINQPIPKRISKTTVIVNGEDFSDINFTSTDLVNRLYKEFDVSMAVFESHLLDNWYGQLFFKHVDQIMPVSRVFINKYIKYPKKLEMNLAQIMGRRVTGNKIFNILVITQPEFTKHQQIIITTAKTLIMKKNAKRELWSIKLGFTKSYEELGYQVWQKGTDQVLSDVKNILEKLKN